MKIECTSGYRGEKPLLRLPSEDFNCNESVSNTSSAVIFRCSVGGRRGPQHLTFYCREPSYGVVTNDEKDVTEAPAITEEEEKVSQAGVDDDIEDFNIGMMLFSEEKYPFALAGKTGFQIWPGTRILVDALTYPRKEDSTALLKWQEKIKEPSFRALELGAGVGVVGASLAAAAGVEVLMTDLEKVVTDSMIPNLRRNATFTKSERSSPPWLSHQSFSIGSGWTAATALDWTQPLEKQLAKEQYNVDLVIACDCVWLGSMLEGLLDTVVAIFQAAFNDPVRRKPTLLLTFQRRDSEMFTTVDRVLAEIKERNLTIECLAWYPVLATDEDDQETNEEVETREVFVFEVCSGVKFC